MICKCGNKLYENSSLVITCRYCNCTWIKDNPNDIGYRIKNKETYYAIQEAREFIGK